MRWNDEEKNNLKSDDELKDKFCEYTGSFVLNSSFKEKLWNDLMSESSGQDNMKNSKKNIMALNIMERVAAVILVCILVGGLLAVVHFRNTMSKDNENISLMTVKYTDSEAAYMSHIKNVKEIENGSESVTENLSYIQNYGIDKISTEILAEFEYNLSLYYDTKLWECSEDRIIMFTTRGAIIYDKNKKQTVATIDLQDIGCMYIRSKYADDKYMDSKAFVENDKLYIFNEASGKVMGNGYVYYLDNINLSYVKALSPNEIIEGTDTLLDKWEKLVGKRIRETYSEIYDENVYQEKEIASDWLLDATSEENLDWMDLCMQWQDSENTDYLSTVAVDFTDKRSMKNVYIILYTKQYGTNEKRKEPISLGFDAAISEYNDKKSIPEYTFSGDDEIMKAVVDYVIEEDLSNNRRYEEEPDTSTVFIPVINIVDTINKGDKKMVFLYFDETKYQKMGRAVKRFGIKGEKPYKLVLLNDGIWKVEECMMIGISDADELDKNNKVFKEYPKLYSKFVKAEKKWNEESLEIEREMLQRYILQNNLDIKWLDLRFEFENGRYINIFDVDMKEMVEKSIGAIGKATGADKRELTSQEYDEIVSENEYYKNIVSLGYDAIDTLEDIIETCDQELEKEDVDKDDSVMIAKFKQTIVLNALEDIMK